MLPYCMVSSIVLLFGKAWILPNHHKYKIKTIAGKQSDSSIAIDIWKDLPSSLKELSVFAFPKHIKRYQAPVRTKTESIFHLTILNSL